MLIWGKEVNLIVASFFFFFCLQVALNCKLPIVAQQYVILATPANLYVRYKLTS